MNMKSSRRMDREPAENMAAHRLPSMFTPEQHTKVFTCVGTVPDQASAALAPLLAMP